MIIVQAAVCRGFTWIGDNSVVDVVSKVGMFGIAVVAVCLTFASFRSNRNAQLFANAVQMYRRYLELAVTHPQLAEPDDYPPIVEPIEFGRYEWFLGVLIRACEELLEYRTTLSPERSQEWLRTVESLLTNHKTWFIKSEWYNSFGKTIYRHDFVEAVERIKARG